MTAYEYFINLGLINFVIIHVSDPDTDFLPGSESGTSSGSDQELVFRGARSGSGFSFKVIKMSLRDQISRYY